MLEVVIIGLEWPEGDSEPNRYIGLQHCALREDLKDGHVLSIKIFLLLRDPVEIQLALQSISDFYLLLTAQGHHVAKPEV